MLPRSSHLCCSKADVNARVLGMRVHPALRIFIPITILATVAAFIYSNVSVVAVQFIDVFVLGSPNVPILHTAAFGFELVPSIKLFWANEAQPLALLVAVFSCVWIYTKLSLLMLVWVTPMPRRWADNILWLLDLAGKWSFLDIFVIGLFGDALTIDAEKFLLLADVRIGLETRPGSYIYMAAATYMCACTNVIAFILRRVDFLAKPSELIAFDAAFDNIIRGGKGEGGAGDKASAASGGRGALPSLGDGAAASNVAPPFALALHSSPSTPPPRSYGAAAARPAPSSAPPRSRGASFDVRATGPIPRLARSAWPAAAAVMDVHGELGRDDRSAEPTFLQHWCGRCRTCNEALRRALYGALTGRPSLQPVASRAGGVCVGGGAGAGETLLARDTPSSSVSRRRTSSASVYGRTWTISVDVGMDGMGIAPSSPPGGSSGGGSSSSSAAPPASVAMEEEMELALNPQYHVVKCSCCTRECSRVGGHAGNRAADGVADGVKWAAERICGANSKLWRAVACCWLEQSRGRGISDAADAVEMSSGPAAWQRAGDESILEGEEEEEEDDDADDDDAGGAPPLEDDDAIAENERAYASRSRQSSSRASQLQQQQRAKCVCECEWVYFGAPIGVRAAVATALLVSIAATIYSCSLAPWFRFTYGGAVGRDLAKLAGVPTYVRDRNLWEIASEISLGNYIHNTPLATPNPDDPLAGSYDVDGKFDYMVYYTVVMWYALICVAPLLFNLSVLLLWTTPVGWPGAYKVFLVHTAQLLAAWNCLDVAALAVFVSVFELGDVVRGTLYQLADTPEKIFELTCGGDAGTCLIVTTDLRFGFWIAVGAIVSSPRPSLSLSLFLFRACRLALTD